MKRARVGRGSGTRARQAVQAKANGRRRQPDPSATTGTEAEGRRGDDGVKPSAVRVFAACPRRFDLRQRFRRTASAVSDASTLRAARDAQAVSPGVASVFAPSRRFRRGCDRVEW